MMQVFVRRSDDEACTTPLILQAGANLNTGESKFETSFGDITSLERDLLLIGAATFAADRCIPRNAREDQNRRIKLSLPVVNTLRIQPHIGRIEEILHMLSHDRWRIELRQSQGQPEANVSISPDCGQTLLFSGGLDSLAAAVEFGENQLPLQLVSHITRNPTPTGIQNALVQLLQSGGRNLTHRQFLVSGTSKEPAPQLSFEAESSQRTRSFMFLILGALCARRRAHERVIMMAENGQLAIHLPLNEARAGAFSTHTAHPRVLAKMSEFLADVLGHEFEIVNPYLSRTKAEVVSVVCENFPEAIPVSNSCWKNSRLPKGFTHCGVCVPCILRRVAIETYFDDSTSYVRDIFVENIPALAPDDDGRRNLYDLVMFVLKMEQLNAAAIIEEFPDLQVIDDPESAVAMYKRAANEMRSVFSGYPNMAALLA